MSGHPGGPPPPPDDPRDKLRLIFPPGSPEQLAQLETDKLKVEVEKLRIQLHTLEREDKREGYRAQDAAGRDATTGPGLINAGAALAVLTFIGTIIAKNSGQRIVGLIPSLGAFSFGVLATMVASGMRFLALSGYRVSTDKGDRWNRRTIGTVAVSYAAFVAGCVLAASALLRVDAPEPGRVAATPMPVQVTPYQAAAPTLPVGAATTSIPPRSTVTLTSTRAAQRTTTPAP